MIKKAVRLPTPSEYRSLASFRHALRRFLDFSARAARTAGLTTQHYQALLALKAAQPDRIVSIGGLAEELLLRHHSAVELVDRLVTRGLVRRVASPADGRRVDLRLTARGESIIARLAATHREELRHAAPAMRRALRNLHQPKRGSSPRKPAGRK